MTAYEMRISDWSSDVCSSDLLRDELDAKDAGSRTRLGAEAYLPLLRATGPFDPAIADLRAFDTTGALTSRIDALEAIAAPVRDRVTLTLDPTERHGFAYQSWFGFQIFVPGQGDAVGRGGGYSIPVGEQEESAVGFRSEEHTSELQSLMRISYAVFCLTKKNNDRDRSLKA